MATYRYNVVIDVSVNTKGASGASATGAFKDIEEGAKRAGNTVGTQMKAIDEATKQSAKSLGIWGQAFRGAFVGAVAGTVFSTIISGITGIVDGIGKLITGSIEMAGKLEMTRNAMTLFAGSAANGRAELAELDQLARNTAGLRMEDAEKGATRLRALGFEAGIVKDLVVGLAKQKLISGVDDEQAMNRVIVNIQQLRAGSPQAMRDIRQMVLALPSLSIEINKAFGSIERFRDAINEDPAGALDKFAKAIANAKAPAGGLMDAIGKLEDAAESMGRAFGEPILEPLTEGIHDVTNGMYNLVPIAREAGQAMVDAFNGAVIAAEAARKALYIPEAKKGSLPEGTAGWLLAQGIPFVGPAATLGMIDRLKKERKDRADAQAEFNAQSGFSGVVYANSGNGLSQRKPNGVAIQDEKESERRESIAINQRYAQLEMGMIKNSYADREAALRLHHRYTTQDEIKYQKDLSAIKIAGLKAEAARENQAYQVDIAKAGTDAKERALIYTKHAAFVNQTQSQIYQMTVDNAEKLDQLREKEADERRRDLEEWNDLEMRSAKQRLDARTFNAERMITQTGAGYAELVSIAEDTYQEVTATIRRNLDLQLQDQSLTDQKRVNLEYQANADIADAREQHRQQMIAISDRESEHFIQNLTRQKDAASELYKDLSAYIGQFTGLFSPSGFSNSSMDIFNSEVLKNSQRAGLRQDKLDATDKYIDAAGKLIELEEKGKEFQAKWSSIVTDVMKNLTAGADPAPLIEKAKKDIGGFEEINKSYADSHRVLEDRAGNAYVALDNVDRKLKDLDVSIPKVYTEFADLAETISVDNVKAFDDLAKSILKAQQQLDMADAKATTAYWGDMIKSEMAGAKNSDKIREYNFNRDKARRAEERLGFQQASQTAEQYAQSLEGLNKELAELASGDPKRMAGLEYAFDAQGIQDQINGYKEIYHLQWEIANGPYLASLEKEKEHLSDIVSLQHSRVAIDEKLIYTREHADAQVAQFLASQKGITEIVSDAKINMLTTAYSGLDAVANRLTRSFGMFRDVVKDLVANMLKLAMNWFAGKTGFFGGGAGGGQGGGGFQIPGFGGQSAGQGGFGGFGGGGGFGGTPAFNGGSGLGTGGGLLGSLGSMSAEGLLTGGGSGAGLIGPATGGASGGGLGGMLGGGGMMAGLGAMLPFLGVGLGASIFNGSTGSKILGGLGGGMAGLGIASLMGVGLPGIAGALIGAASLFAAPAVLIGAYFLSRNAKRRKEEKIRDSALGDAFSQIDKLISDVNGDKIDGAGALSQADQIRANYMTEMGKLKDKKTRQHALADVSRIDGKISDLKAAVEAQVTRKDRLELMVPTFAAGGHVQTVAAGYQTGPEAVGYFPSAGTIARFNEQGSEYVFDAETTRNIGVANLDAIRQSKGKSIGQMRTQLPAINRASGGSVSPIISMPSQSSGTSSAPVKLEISLNVGLSAEDFAQVVSAQIQNNDGSREQLDAIVTTLKNQGYTELAAELGRQMRSGSAGV